MLKKYHRKKRYYKLFMLDSPCSAGIITLNAAFAAIMLKPFALLSVLAMFATKIFSFYILFPLLWLVMTIITFAIPIAFKRHKKKNKLHLNSKEFYLKHWDLIFILLGLAAILYFKFNYFSIIIAFVSFIAFFIHGHDDKPLKKRAHVFLAFNIFFVISLALLAHFSDKFISDKAQKISLLINRDVTFDSYMEREKNGFQFDSEPLQSLIDTAPKHENKLYYNVLSSKKEAKQKLHEYEKKYPQFCKSAKEFAALHPSKYGIGHQISSDNCLYNTKMFTQPMRESARYFAWLMQCNPYDRKVIAECNKTMQNIRDFCLNSNNLLYHLVGIAIETMRLQALVSTLQFNDINESEFKALLGSQIDWMKFFRYGCGDELTHMESLIKYLPETTSESYTEFPLGILRKTIPHHFKIYLTLNYIAFADKIENSVNISKSSLSEKEKLAAFVQNKKKTGLLLCDMFGPPTDNVYKRCIQMNDLRTMAEIAFKINEYRRSNGKLPDDLNFLSAIPQDCIHGKKFIYKKGDIKLHSSDETTYHGFILAVDEFTKYGWSYSLCRLTVKSE